MEELLGPDLLARLDRLDLVSRRTFAGKLPGERRSKRRGRSVEFADYRTYAPGDDLRHIDWNVFARLDRLFIKLFLEEEDLSVHVAVDISQSMDAGAPSKALFSLRLAMALAYIGLVGRNRVSVSAFGRGPMRMLPELRGRANAQRIGRFLLDCAPDPAREPEGATDTFAQSMRRIAQAPSGAGVLVLLSDFLVPEGCDDGLKMIAGRRTFESACVQILSPGEVDPAKETRDALVSLTGDLRLIDVETGLGREVTITAPLLKRYRENLERYTAGLEQFCLSRDMQYMLVTSDASIETLLLDHFRKRGLLR